MLSRSSLLRCLALATLAPALTGCGGSADEPTASTPSKTPKPNALQAVAARARAASEATEQASKPASSEQVAASQPEYEPPFPDRIDLFAPPKQGARLARQTTDDSADSVVLMGFAKLDEPRVLLAINGVVKPLSHGEQAFGVEVISIAPPRAVLQRGRSRWTASIE